MSLITGKSYGRVDCYFMVEPLCPGCGCSHGHKEFDALEKASHYLETNTRLCYDCEEEDKTQGNTLTEILKEIDRILCIQGHYDYSSDRVIEEIGKQIDAARKIIYEEEK